MGKRLLKAELLKAIHPEQAALEKTLDPLTRRQMTQSGVTRGGWPVKDILVHLAEWQQMNLDWFASGLRGEKVHMAVPGHTLRDLSRSNQMIYRIHHRRSLQAVLKVTKWEENPYHHISTNSKLSKATVEYQCIGEIEGKAIVKYLMF
jgi:hypothetical protein